MLKTVLATALLLGWGVQAKATVIVPTSSAVQAIGGPAGLSGTYYKAAPGSTGFDIADTLSAMTPGNIAGTFRATTLGYSGSDSSTITAFLGTDGSSYKGRTPASYDLSDGILDMSGFLRVATAGTYTFALNHDDSAQLSIGGQLVVSANCCGTNTADVAFGTAGYYALDLVYSNTYFGNGTGGATVSLAENGSVLNAGSLVTSVPEPASLALLGAGLAGTVFLRRRTATAA